MSCRLNPHPPSSSQLGGPKLASSQKILFLGNMASVPRLALASSTISCKRCTACISSFDHHDADDVCTSACMSGLPEGLPVALLQHPSHHYDEVPGAGNGWQHSGALQSAAGNAAEAFGKLVLPGGCRVVHQASFQHPVESPIHSFALRMIGGCTLPGSGK